MFSSFTAIFIVGIVVFFIITVFLLCFTRSSIELPISLGSYSEFDEWPLDSEDSIACLPEDARLSYDRAKSKYHLPVACVIKLIAITMRILYTSLAR